MKKKYVYGFKEKGACVYGRDVRDEGGCFPYIDPCSLKKARKGIKTLDPTPGEIIRIYELVPVDEYEVDEYGNLICVSRKIEKENPRFFVAPATQRGRYAEFFLAPGSGVTKYPSLAYGYTIEGAKCAVETFGGGKVYAVDDVLSLGEINIDADKLSKIKEANLDLLGAQEASRD